MPKISIYLSAAAVLDRRMQRAAFVITCTEDNRRRLQALATSTTPIHCIYHGLDTTWWHTPPQETSTPRDEAPVLLSIGRLREKKGFFCLLAACRRLQETGSAFCCVIIGYGPLRQTLERRIEALGLQATVRLVGPMAQEELIAHYQHATLFVLPCQILDDGDRDGIPNVLVEAMATGLAVVSTPISGIPELIEHNVDGLLVPPQDSAALAEALAALLHDAVLRRQLGKNARDKVCRRFDSTQTTVQLKTLFESCLDVPRRTTR